MILRGTPLPDPGAAAASSNQHVVYEAIVEVDLMAAWVY